MGFSHYLPPIPSPLNLSLGTVCRTFSGCGHHPHALRPPVLLHTYIRTFPPHISSPPAHRLGLSSFFSSLTGSTAPRYYYSSSPPIFLCVPFPSSRRIRVLQPPPLIPSPPTRPKPAITNYDSANILIAHSRWTVFSTRSLSVRSQT